MAITEEKGNNVGDRIYEVAEVLEEIICREFEKLNVEFDSDTPVKAVFERLSGERDDVRRKV